MLRIASAVVAFAFAGTLSSHAFAGKTTYINECPHEFFVAIGQVYGGGSDDIGAGGSWAKAHSVAWFRIGPYQRETIGFEGYTHSLIQSAAGIIVSDLQPSPNNRVRSFCHSRDRFDFTIDLKGNKQWEQCRSLGGANLVTYQAMYNANYQTYNTFTIRACDRP